LVVTEFGIDPGTDLQATPDGLVYSVRDPRADARAILYRSAAARIPAPVLPWLHMITFDQASSAAFCAVLGRHVGVLPTPHVATAPCRSRSGKRPITVAVLGNQRPEKGYQFMPEVARTLLAPMSRCSATMPIPRPCGRPRRTCTRSPRRISA
jgi:hypothetical protein